MGTISSDSTVGLPDLWSECGLRLVLPFTGTLTVSVLSGELFGQRRSLNIYGPCLCSELSGCLEPSVPLYATVIMVMLRWRKIYCWISLEKFTLNFVPWVDNDIWDLFCDLICLQFDEKSDNFDMFDKVYPSFVFYKCLGDLNALITQSLVLYLNAGAIFINESPNQLS